MTYPFGQTFELWFFPLVNDTTPEGLDTSQTPTIHIFSSQPSRADAASGTGAVGSSITAWTWDAGKKGWSFTVPAISDPNPTSSEDTRTYWVAVNFKLTALAQTQTVLQAFQLVRVGGHLRTPTIGEADLFHYLPQVRAHTTESQRIDFIAEAVDDVKGKLRSEGYVWAQLHHADRLSKAVTFRALMMICLARIKQDNDEFAKRFVEFKELYQTKLAELVAEYDSNRDGQADADVKPGASSYILVIP